MNIGELETVTTYDLPVKVVVLNNFGDGMVKQWQKLFFKGRLSASATRRCTRRISSRPRRPTASGTPCGSTGRPTCRASSKNSWSSRAPAFLEVIIDPDAGVYPMVGPGQAYEEMITGDFIESPGCAQHEHRADASEMLLRAAHLPSARRRCSHSQASAAASATHGLPVRRLLQYRLNFCREDLDRLRAGNDSPMN